MNRALAPDRETRIFLGLVAFSLAGSLFTRLSHLDPGLIAPVASILTLACGVLASFKKFVSSDPRPWPKIAVALGVGASVEVVGLASGFPFGRYVYTGAWWPSLPLPGLGPFPLLLPFAWLLMAGSATFAARQWLNPNVWPWWRPALLGGLLASVVDLVMEPVMTGPLHYWRWLNPGALPGGAPLTNFLGWWATATVAGAILCLSPLPSGLEARSPSAAWVLAGFMVLILGLGWIG